MYFGRSVALSRLHVTSLSISFLFSGFRLLCGEDAQVQHRSMPTHPSLSTLFLSLSLSCSLDLYRLQVWMQHCCKQSSRGRRSCRQLRISLLLRANALSMHLWAFFHIWQWIKKEMYADVLIRIFIYMCMWAYRIVCIYMYMYIYIYTYMNIWRTSIGICIYTCIYLYICILIYIFIYMYVNSHMYTYI